jgi:hypothetical protein
MEFTTWAYPWDLLDEGVDAVADRLAAIGVSEVALATNYHHVQAFLPHNPERRTLFARASSYFRPGEEYGRLEPVPYEGMDGDWLATIADRIADTDLSLSSWTVGCHNSRLGLEHREATLTTPHGDDLVFGLCPSHPDVQTYLLALVRDLDDRADFERIELESFDYFYGTGFGWHHEKYHTRLGRLGEFLFGLCFCEHCRANARAAGVDVAAARTAARETVDAIAAGALPHDLDLAGWLDAHPAVRAYVRARTTTLAALFGDLAAAVDAQLGYYVGLLGIEDAWLHGADLAQLADPLDYMTVLTYVGSRGEAVDRYRTARHLAGSDVALHAGVRPGHPDVYDGATVSAIVDGLADEGAPRVEFYNYGLLPERNLEWVGAATEPYV